MVSTPECWVPGRADHISSAVLNICFPYTSRAEMTAAIKATVDEFTTPPEPAAASFSQARITQTIRSNQLMRSGSSTSLRESSPEPGAKSDVDDSVSSTTTLNPDSPQTTPQKKGRTAALKDPESITVKTINSHMYTADCPPLDIFIRTSNVMRLSDFMLWQCHENTHIFFLKCFWPEMDLWHFIPVLLEWQWRQKKERDDRAARQVKME